MTLGQNALPLDRLKRTDHLLIGPDISHANDLADFHVDINRTRIYSVRHYGSQSDRSDVFRPALSARLWIQSDRHAHGSRSQVSTGLG